MLALYAAVWSQEVSYPCQKLMETVQNAEQETVSMRYATLYAMPLVTINRGGYTKHYFEGGHRVCTAVGGGFGGVDWSAVEEQAGSEN